MPTHHLDHSKLTLRDALDLAILVEEEAMERYMVFADQMEAHQTPEAARFFRFMSNNESKHGNALRERRKKLFGKEPRTVERTMIFDVEAPSQELARPVITHRRALLLALGGEEKAHAFFVDALPRVKDAEVKALFEELRDEELKHQEMVQAQLDKVLEEPGEEGFGRRA